MSWMRIISLAVGFLAMDMLVDILMLTLWTRHCNIKIIIQKEQADGKKEESTGGTGSDDDSSPADFEMGEN